MINVCEAILNTPHALIAGTTGSGKSVLLNGVICEGLNRNVEFWFIDLKRVELNQYKKTYNCLRYVTEPEEVMPLLDDIIDDMDDEYERMESLGIKESTRPHRYLVIDELADLVSTKGVLDKLVKLGRLGRAAHIHMIGATQDPSRYTLSAQLMQNITCSVALKCKTAIESKQIVGVAGAEMLPPHGKGLITTYGGVKKVDIPLTPDSVIQDAINTHAKAQRPSQPCASSQESFSSKASSYYEATKTDSNETDFVVLPCPAPVLKEQSAIKEILPELVPVLKWTAITVGVAVAAYVAYKAVEVIVGGLVLFVLFAPKKKR